MQEKSAFGVYRMVGFRGVGVRKKRCGGYGLGHVRFTGILKSIGVSALWIHRVSRASSMCRFEFEGLGV